MRAVAKALKTFVGSFALPAYPADSVPEDVQAPYLVYPLQEPEWDKKATFYIQGWYRTTGIAALAEKADEIIAEIGTGITINTDSGYLVIYPETPLVQYSKADDYRSFYINLSINAYQLPGYYPSQNTDNASANETPGADPEEGVVNAET